MAKRIPDWAFLLDNKQYYQVNGVLYEVNMVFAPETKENHIENRVFRIIENQSAHLIKNASENKIDNEYMCLDCGKEDANAV